MIYSLHMWKQLPITLLVMVVWWVGCDSDLSSSKAQSKGALDEREGIAYEHGSNTPYSGSLSRKYPNGQVSTETVYTNGLKLQQRSWFTNGTMKSEFRFYKGQLATRRSWKMDGEPQSWKQEGLSTAQLQRALKLIEGKGVQQDFVQAYVWVFAAATNGHPQAQMFLSKSPSGMTQADMDAAEAIANRLLASEN